MTRRGCTFWLIRTLTVCGLMMLCACDGAPKSAESDEATPLNETVTLSELKTQSAIPEAPLTVPTAPSLSPKYNRKLVVQMLALPERSQRVAIATATLDEPRIDPAVLANWRANGFGVGTLPVHRVSLFTANLPRAYVSPVFRMGVTSTYNPVTLIDRVRGVVRFDYITPGGEPEPMKFIGGQCQLMLRLEAPLDNIGPLKLDLLPHHYNPTTRLLPTDAYDRALDGDSFDDLRIYRPIDDDHVLVFYLDSPSAMPDDAEAAENASETAKSAEQPKTLGDAMLRGRKGSRAIQWLVMIGLEQRTDASGGPAESAAANQGASVQQP